MSPKLWDEFTKSQSVASLGWFLDGPLIGALCALDFATGAVHRHPERFVNFSVYALAKNGTRAALSDGASFRLYDLEGFEARPYAWEPSSKGPPRPNTTSSSVAIAAGAKRVVTGSRSDGVLSLFDFEGSPV